MWIEPIHLIALIFGLVVANVIIPIDSPGSLRIIMSLMVFPLVVISGKLANKIIDKVLKDSK